MLNHCLVRLRLKNNLKARERTSILSMIDSPRTLLDSETKNLALCLFLFCLFADLFSSAKNMLFHKIMLFVVNSHRLLLINVLQLLDILIRYIVKSNYH